MLYTYEPEVVEEDDGYSIPKILVALLLLVVIGAGVYIYFQKQKLTASMTYLLDEKKKVKQELDAMITKYTLAIDENEFLADELIDERKNIIEMRNSVDNMTEDDFKGVTNYRQRIQDMAETTNFVTASIEVPKSTVVNTSTPPVEEPSVTEDTVKVIEPSKKTTESPNKPKTILAKEETTQPATKNKTLETPETTEEVAKTTTTTAPVIETTIKEKIVAPKETPKKEVVTVTTLGRVEIPPTYPGCSGDADAKRKCFNKQVRKFVSSKFDASISGNMDLSPGKKRVFAMFNIDKQGRIVNVRAKAEHPKLEAEAIRVVKKLPKMLAARQNGNAVGIRNYTVPIHFVIEDN